MIIYMQLLCALVVTAASIYYYLVCNFDFWRKRGVPGPEPRPLFGNLKDVILARVCTSQIVKEILKTYKNEPVVGLYSYRSPILILNDPDIIKSALIKDFSKFANRQRKPNGRTEPMSINIFHLESERWRPLRQKLSPMFTSGKLKGMFNLMVECSQNLDKYLDQVASKNEVVKIHEVTANYTMDVIGNCAFGINLDTMSDKDNEFRKQGKMIFEGSIENVIRLRLRMYLPRLYDLLGFVFPDRKIAPFFTSIVTETMRYRKENNVYRPDFIHLLMELRDHPEKLDELEFTDQLLTAQAYMFFAAGHESTSTAMSWALLELAQNQDIQDKLREEMRQYAKKYNNQITYETMKEMDYLDKVFRETLRKYPVGSVYTRITTSDYTFETLNFTIPKSTEVWIPILMIHRNPVVYPDPTKFDPERFTKEAIAARHPMHYLPFSDGPRNCIGMRFAVFKWKLGIFKILLRYKVEICEQTKLPFEFNPRTFLLAPKDDIYLKMTKVA
nr:cytochrome P450 6B1-like [Megalopta genalis]